MLLFKAVLRFASFIHYNLQILDGPQHISFDFSEAIFFQFEETTPI